MLLRISVPRYLLSRLETFMQVTEYFYILFFLFILFSATLSQYSLISSLSVVFRTNSYAQYLYRLTGSFIEFYPCAIYVCVNLRVKSFTGLSFNTKYKNKINMGQHDMLYVSVIRIFSLPLFVC